MWLARAPFLHALLNGQYDGGRTYRSHLRAHGSAVGPASARATWATARSATTSWVPAGCSTRAPSRWRKPSRTAPSGAPGGSQVVARGRVHFIGLLSDGNVHSHIRHLDTCCAVRRPTAPTTLVVHALFDGRDVIDHTAEQYLATLEATLADGARRVRHATAVVGSGGGRMATTMDRYEADWTIVRARLPARTSPARPAPFTVGRARRWPRCARSSPGVSDQFLPEFTVVDDDGTPVGSMHDGDAVVLFNFRGDRMIEIYRALTEDAVRRVRPRSPAGRPAGRRAHHVRRRPGHPCAVSWCRR